ncbi:THO complex subunit 7 family protein [Brachybacterium subflavum]|uniref:hypothetical protein n=1 Tax=Brachybacterium subflavum TaxID=2585206 RepID=UPI00126658EA|nr:hypothetical protein [Brachybacterium subflavum]
MEAFATARFATHPDGRIAARVSPENIAPWAVPFELGEKPLFHSDSVMSLEGWSPLDETRLPRVVTDEFVDFVHEDYFWSTSDRVRLEKPALRHALNDAVKRSTAPTTDDTSVDYHAMWRKAEREREQAEATAERYGRTIDKLQARIKELEVRAERAEQERDSWRSQVPLAEWEKDLIENRPLTAREHRDAMWARGHRPVNGAIPAGTPYMFRDPDGFIGVDLADHDVPAIDGPEFVERRLIDPPTPTRPEGAEALSRLIADADVDEWNCGDLADYLAKHGVRVTEDGTP